LYDTIIVGAGPIGSYIAGELASCGHKVIVFERQEGIGKAHCCTGILGKECLDAFPAGREAVLREAKSARFFAPSGNCLTVEKETVQAYIVDRTAFDNKLARIAQMHGAEYHLESRVTDVTTTEDLACVQVKNKQGTITCEGKAVVIASGFDSKLPQRLGFGKNSDFVMGAQAEVVTKGIDEVEVYFGSHIAPGFFAWLVPTSNGKALAGLLCRHHTGSYLKGFLGHLANQGKIASPDVKISYGGIPLKPLPRTAGRRAIVVGDAAGQVKPTTGGGIYYGLLCAQIAADTLHQALCANDLTAKRLSSYEKEWRAVLARELWLGRQARWLFEKLNDRQIEGLFRLGRAKHLPESLLSIPDFSFDWHGRLITRGARALGLRSAFWLACSLVSAQLFRRL
jgi:digeranylgeranylglycerophospholipid reductase